MSIHICHVSTFSPTPCGIATYTESLIANLPKARHHKLRLLYHCDVPAPEFQELKVEDKLGYSAAASALNRSSVNVVSLQHEFSIWGGRDGEYVVDFAKRIEKPLVVTLHTTPMMMSAGQKRIVQEIVGCSNAVIVLTEQAKANVTDIAGDSGKVFVIRHGVPDVDFRLPSETVMRQKWNRKHVFFSAGHVSDRKGYTNTLAALAQLRKSTDDFLYIIVGSYQPQFGSNAQCVYSLKRMIKDYGLTDNVWFHETYLDLPLLLEYISASDIGVVTYTDCQQSSSGMVPLLLACGRPVVATPFEYAVSTSKIIPGLYLASAYQSSDILEVLRAVLNNKSAILGSMPTIFGAMRPWAWPKAANSYLKLFLGLCSGAPLVVANFRPT